MNIDWISIKDHGLPTETLNNVFVTDGKYIDVAWFDATNKKFNPDSNVNATYDESGIEWQYDFDITHYAQYTLLDVLPKK
jgi:glutamine cyclotransferase